MVRATNFVTVLKLLILLAATATKRVSVAAASTTLDSLSTTTGSMQFIALMDELGVANQPTTLGFSVSANVRPRYAGNNQHALLNFTETFIACLSAWFATFCGSVI